MKTTALSDDQVTRLHEAGLLILQKVGVEIPHPEILRRFADHGAQVDFDRRRVRLPPEVTLRLVESAGHAFSLYGRDTSQTAAFGKGSRNYNSSSGQALWIEQLGGPRRYPTLADVTVATRVGDALDGITIVGAMGDPHDCNPAFRSVAVCAELLRSTTKPVTLWFHDRASTRFLIEMMIALRGSEEAATNYPLCYPFLEPISPLRFPFHGIDLLFETCRLSLPVPVGPMAQMGLSAPATIAGTIAQEHAEILAGICVVQLVKPGTPVCYSGVCHAFDMGLTQVIFGGPEQVIFSVAMTQMGKFLGLPVYVNAGLLDAKTADLQAGVEMGVTLAQAAAAGADIFGHLGIVGADQGANLALLVMQNELIRYVERVMQPPAVTAETLGLEIIRDVDVGGTFIDQQHTVDHFRHELARLPLFDRQYYEAWLTGGGEDMKTRAERQLAEIVNTHQPEPLADDLEREISRIVDAAKSRLDNSQPVNITEDCKV